MLNDATGFKHIYVAVGYTDLRGGIDRLVSKIKYEFDQDPYEEGSIFLFCGRRTDRIKAVTYEGDGWLLLYKRLSGEGRFQWPRNSEEAITITPDQFRWLMQGLSIEQKKAIKRVLPTVI